MPLSIKVRKDGFQIARWDFLICLLLVGSILSVYWQVRNHEFVVYDDFTYITKNQYVRDGLTLQGLSWAFSFKNKDKTYWHPLTWLSHMLDVQLYGLTAGKHLYINVLIHILNTLLLFFVLRNVTDKLWQSALVAAMFALHPINVESVVWVAARKNVLSTLFWMLTLWAYVNYSKQPGFARYLIILLGFALGLMAKPVLAMLPFVFLLLDYWPLRRLQFVQLPSSRDEDDKSPKKRDNIVSRGYLILEKFPLFVLSFIAIFLSSFSLQRYGDMISAVERPISLRIANAFVSYVVYLGKMIWPQNLTCFYPFPKAVPLWQSLGALFFLIAFTCLVIKAGRQKPYLLTGWFWYLGTLLPVIGLMQAGLWPAMADRYAYVPSIGIFIIISWGLYEFAAKWNIKKATLSISLGGIIIVLSILTWLQAGYWKNTITLFEHNVAVAHKNHLSYYALGFAYEIKGKLRQAADYYRKSLSINPKETDVHYNLAIVLNTLGDRDGAIQHYLEVLQIDPEDLQARNNLANALFHQGKLDEAIDHYYKALRIDPGFAKVHNNLGAALLRKGKAREAADHFQKALFINPSDRQTQINLKTALMIQKKNVETEMQSTVP